MAGTPTEVEGLVDVEDLVRRSVVLEPLLPSAVRLARLVAAPDPDLDEIIAAVTYDQALTGKLLGHANSAVSATRHPVTTVRGAVVRMGLGPVLSFTLASVARSHLDQAIPAYDLAEGQLWRHSLAAALAAECLAETTRADVPAESVAAALLHDLGKLALHRYLDPGVLGILDHAFREAGYAKMAVETQLLGVHHGELGGLIAEEWGLPAGIVEGIAYHHLPDHGRLGVADVVHVANELARIVTADLPADEEEEQRFPLLQAARREVLDRLGLDEDAARTTLRLARERYDERLALHGG